MSTASTKKRKFIIGIDEAGRGPLAGPVSIGVIKFPSNFDKKLLKNIKDSKKLSLEAREEWFKKLKEWKKEGKVDFSSSLVGAKHIDTHGISSSIRKAIRSCLRKLEAGCDECEILLDGSLFAPKEFLHQKTIIRGDERVPIIALASIAAKVRRDRHMRRQAKRYTVYRFEEHVGYGTKTHRDAIVKYGPCEIHRLSFLKNILTQASKQPS